MGSSPLTRGKQQLARGCILGCGLIPAHAGKTPVACLDARNDRAHPRSRGENGGTPKKDNEAEGSSPLTRGKPAGHSPAPPSLRLIPAHAGKTRLST